MRYIEEADKTLIKKFDEIRQKGYYVNSNQVTSLYNKILEKNVNNTTCGSCLRGRIQELVNALRKQEQAEKKAKEAAKKAEEETKVAEVDNIPQETKEAVTEQINDAQDEAELSQTIKEHEEAVEELIQNEKLESKGFLTKEEEPKNEPVTQRTTKKRKTSKPKANR